MNFVNTVILFLILPFIELIAFYAFYKYYSQYNKISKTDTSRIGFLKEGYHEIKGKVVSLSENLISPLSEKPCVYYNFKVKEKDGLGKNARWVSIIEDEKYIRFSLVDDSGQAIIDLKDSERNFKHDIESSSGVFNKSTPQMKNAIKKYKKRNPQMLFEKSMRYNETYIKEGDNLYILGEVKEFEDYKPIFKSEKTPLFISDKSEKELLTELKRKLIAVGVILVLVPIIVYLIL